MLVLMNSDENKTVGKLITPKFINGGIRKSYSISIQNFSSKPPQNYKGYRQYLVIGFDTEYQRVESKNTNEETFYSSVYPYPDPNSPDNVSLNKDEEDDSDIYTSRLNHYKSGGRGTL